SRERSLSYGGASRARMEKPPWGPRGVSWLPTVSNEVRAMRKPIITSIFLALICGQTARGQQAPPPKSRRQDTAAAKVYPASGKRIRIVAGTKRTLVDLTDDVQGCLKLYDSYSSKRIGNQHKDLSSQIEKRSLNKINDQYRS